MQKDNYIKFIFPVFIIVLWLTATNLGNIPETALPKLSSVKTAFVEMLKTGQLYSDLGISIRRVLGGYIISSILGISIGITMGISKRIKETMLFSLTSIRQVPMVAWIPLIILWTGIGEISKITVIFFAATFPIIVNTINGIDSTPENYLELAKAYKLNKIDTFFKVYLPSALPNIFIGLRLGLSASWMAVVAAELVASSSGIGYRLNDARSLMKSDVVIVCMILIGITGVLMDKIITLIAQQIMSWKYN